MERTRTFYPSDRYAFDCGICSQANGFAQVDTKQDASYFGTWANPETFTIVSYSEGDVCKTICDNEQEFITAIEELKTWNEDAGYWIGIDAGWNDSDGDVWRKIGLGHLLH